MDMVEKQDAFDVRANTTTATPLEAEGRGRAHASRGHKWVFSAPTCDARLVVVRTADGGMKNPVQSQRLQDKLGTSATQVAKSSSMPRPAS